MFIVLLESALIETSTCGMIKSKIGHIIEDLDNVRNVNWCLYTMSVLKLGMENWSKTEKNAFAGPLPFLMTREDEVTNAGIFGLRRIKKRYIRNVEQQQANVEQNLDVDDSGVGSSQNILPTNMVINVVKYIKQINDGMSNLVRVLKEASSQINNNDLFRIVCDIARSAIGSQKSPVESVSDTFLHLSQSLHIDNTVVVDYWKAVFDSILNGEKEKETLEDLNEFPTF
ncbi:hypothetical protein SASPL_156478 [Salvia splendens]|uniref:Uncharacterized protein n=1 Tax=Salvia splendens TaxID=180675 RepID=A0A8X8VWN8_SALSN|nr:hypothetical protein SASPL_156478 [Salvia splendens]